MKYSNNISTNILRDRLKDIDYVVTPNAKEIFDRMFLHNYGSNKSFNLIGNYGTGKSTFLWALEKNLKREKMFFSNIYEEKDVIDYEFINVIGENKSLHDVINKSLGINKGNDESLIIEALEGKRKAALKDGKGLVVIIDEFGKFLEYASKNKAIDELFLLQQISEWANNDSNETYFIITLHQNFSSYGKDLSSQDKLEWEKVKGRFVDLVFNEPVEQLIYFAGKKLSEFNIPKKLEAKFKALIGLIKKSKLVSHNKSVSKELSQSIYPLDWLSANVLVNSLQRYGQNERSLFSFLNDETNYSIKNVKKNFYSVSNVFDYLVNTLPTEINSSDNPHRAQWLTTFRALEKAELIFEERFEIVSDLIKTIGLVNIFSKVGGKFDEEFIIEYFKLTRGESVDEILAKLKKAGIIRFYKHSNKINFLEGTDIDLEQELISINKEINTDFSLSNEILNRIDFPVLLVKKYSFITGTKRFFEFRVLDSLQEISSSEGAIDGFINLVFNEDDFNSIKKKSSKFNDNVFLLYQNTSQIKEEVLMIMKFDKLLEKHQLDKNALKLLSDEREYHLQYLQNLVVSQMFNNDKNVWIHNGETKSLNSKHELYEWLTSICFEIYSKTPVFNNELINREFISTPINVARKKLLRSIILNEQVKGLGFPKDKFPPEKAIFISLLGITKIHKKNKIGYYELSKPNKGSSLSGLWEESENFLKSTISNKRNLNEFYEILKKKPYKLKKGLIDFWIPMFLLSKKEDYALFHINGGFIPFISEDTIDLIHKKPQDFLIKSYDVSGLKVNLLETYKELVQIGDSKNKGTQSTFLSIFGNFLRFQRGLNQYTLKTSKLSTKAIKLREAIIKSKDPEDALFNQFPLALGYHTLSIKKDEEVLNSFTKHIEGAIREIRSAYDELLNRLEIAIVDSFDCSSFDFNIYKEEIISKIEGINPASLGQTQGVFYKRLLSPLDDRISWIKSVSDVALGKGIDELLDEEEPLLVSGIKDLSLGIIKATDIQKYNKHSNQGKLYSIRFFGETGEFIDNKLVINSKNTEEFNEVKNLVSSTINGLDEVKRKELLIELLSKEMSI